MTLNTSEYSNILESLPDAVVLHQIVGKTREGEVDYICREANKGFEKLVDRRKEQIIGKKVSRVETFPLDWKEVYKAVSDNGGKNSFEQFHDPSQRWYKVISSRIDAHHFLTIFRDISEKKKNLSLQSILSCTEKYVQYDVGTINYQTLTDDLRTFCGATFVCMNLYEKSGQKAKTVAVSGDAGSLKKSLVGKKWEVYPAKIRELRSQRLVQYNKLYDIVHACLNKDQAVTLEKTLQAGKIYAAGIIRGERVLGEFVIVMPQGKTILEPAAIELLIKKIGMVVSRYLSEKRLLESEERFKNLLALIPDMVSIQDSQMNILFSNWKGPADVSPAKRKLSTKCYKTYRGYDAICPDCVAQKVFDTKKTLKEEKQTVEGIWFDVRIIPFLNKEGEVECFLEWVRDITERKERERDILRQNRLLESVINAIPDIIAIQKPDHTIQQFNRAGYEWLEVTAEEVKNQKCYKLLGRNEPCEECATELALQSHQLEEIEKYLPDEDRYLHCRSNPVLDEKGNVVQIVEQLRDITPQKEVEERLRRDEEYLRGILESQQELIVRVDINNRFTFVNDTYCKMFGKKREELIGKTFIPFIYEDDVEPSLQAMKKLFKPPYRVYFEQRAKTVKGWRWIGWEDNAIRNKEGEIVGAQGVGRDITERKEAEINQRKILEEQDILLNNIEARVWYLRDVETYGAVNKAHARFLGLTQKEISYRTLWEFFPYEIAKTCIQGNKRVFEDRKQVRTEEWIPDTTGVPRLFDITKTPSINHEGEVEYVVCSAIDITERKKAEERLSSITKCFLDFTIDHRENIRKLMKMAGTLLNASYASYFSCKEQSSSTARWKKHPTSAFPVDIEDKIISEMWKDRKESLVELTDCHEFLSVPSEKRTEKESISSYVGKAIDRDNRVGFLNLYFRGKAYLEPGLKNILDIISTAIGIEEEGAYYRKLLHERKKLLQVTLDNITDSVITTDAEGRSVLLNDESLRLLQEKREKVRGKHINEVLFLYCGREDSYCRNVVHNMMEKGKSCQYARDLIMRKGEDKQRHISLSGAAIKNNEGKITGMVFVLRDITDTLKYEEEMVKREKLESVGTLAAGIAHDFNNLLMGLFGSLEMAEKALDSKKKVKQYLNNAFSAYERAQNLTRQLLTFSRGGAFSKEPHSIHEILQNTSTLALSGTNISYQIEADTTVWSTHIDKSQIEQAIDNILINAREAMTDGGNVHIKVQNIPAGKHEVPLLKPQQPHIMISISDEGEGIPQKYLSSIFDPFFTTKTEGTGLGLSTVYSIIRQHDGYITVDSSSSEGTTFTIYLPAFPDLKHKPERKQKVQKKGKGKILVMDDEEMILDVAAEMLQDMGYEPVPCTHGEEALERYEEALKKGRPFDVLIVDLTVPGKMGGTKLVEVLREKHSDVVVIACSGYFSDPVMLHPEEYGFDDKIPKPYRYEQLSEILEKVINRSQQ